MALLVQNERTISAFDFYTHYNFKNSPKLIDNFTMKNADITK